MLQLQSRVESLSSVDPKFQTVTRLTDLDKQAKRIVKELQGISNLAKDKIMLVKQHHAIFKYKKYHSQLKSFSLKESK